MCDRLAPSFDALPADVRESIFLLLRPTCRKDSASWRAGRNRSMAAHRRDYAKIVAESEVRLDTFYMLVSRANS
jgi:hypothetical protein